MSETVKILIGFLTISLAISLLWNIKTRMKIKRLEKGNQSDNKIDKLQETSKKLNEGRTRDTKSRRNNLIYHNTQNKEDVNWDCKD